MKKITLSEYNSISEAYRGVWTTERWDIPECICKESGSHCLCNLLTQ